MASSLNRVLQGRKLSYKLIEVLKSPSIFKATIVPKSQQMPSVNKHVVIKDVALERELRAHQLPAIKASPYIRQALDVIEKREDEDWSPSPPSITNRIVLEWMDTDLWLPRPLDKGFSNPKLPQIVARSILEALVVFQEMKGVHTGVAKNSQNAQTHETRAPEVWQGLGVWHTSDIWSLGVTLSHWLMSRGLFGPCDKIIQDHNTAWCLAKIFRLIGPIDLPENPEYQDEFELAAALEASGYMDPNTGEPKPYINVGSLREELQKLPRDICSESCIDFIEHLLVIDPAKRPTAKVALQHPFLQSTAS
ncbi:hypothetical protein P175DRAFT_0516733 [Aspergillus ochraceoroseus IBT 24754]|uniref:Protein kinase domain-containing protein n=1 Tax=Aspergillus ochraceoroseus IBT 24754 TaxID=1392256 RepID=A0A2T5LY05_9EURO|nr:uncharacterized protein P175DRAFT_0516733 [Aspergillus ochraceoroseus IBT 24754]PTU21165.1 hypothetical protein P175DRAFT_0516733 [Aspergillus ochraceoroseus IBT 24754]